MSVEMTTKQAISSLVQSGLSSYAIAKLLNLSGGIMVSNYLKRTKMSRKTADKILEVCDIKITDVYLEHNK